MRTGRTFVVEESRTIPMDIDRVFAYAADFSNIAEWDPGMDRSTQLSPGDPGIGTRYELAGHFGPAKMTIIYEVTEWEPPRRAVLVGKGKSFDSIDTLVFAPLGDEATRLTYTGEITLYNVLRFLGPVVTWLMGRVGERGVDGLVKALLSRAG